MPGVITTGNHPAALWPGVREFFGTQYKEKELVYPMVYDVRSSGKNYEEDVAVTGFGLAPVKSEGSAVSYDSDTQEWIKRYTHIAYALGFIVTREELDDNLYKNRAFRRSRALAFSMRQTQEIIGALTLDRATDSAYVGGDGKELLATDHPSQAGNWSNELATAADFSEAALEDLFIQIRNAKDTRGLRIALRPRKMVIPPNLMFDVHRITKSTLRAGTSDNDANAMRDMGLLPDGIVVNDYLTDTDQWFVLTDAPNGLTWFNRVTVELSNDNDFDTMNAKAKAYMRFSTGWTDPRGVFGSPGA